MARITFKDKNTNGVEVPDGMITIGATDAYKLLEALNIDWKNIDIPWAKSIERWNSKSYPATNDDGSPKTYGEYSAGMNNITKNDSPTFEEVNNSVDWLRREYDYLTDNEYTDGNYVYVPDWAKDGKIHKSEEIIDVINYLIWRVVNIDYYTAHWDQRNSSFAIPIPVIGWTNTNLDSLPKKDGENLYLDRYYTQSWYDLHVTLKPTFDRSPVDVLSVSTDTNIADIYNYYASLGYGDDIFPMIVSESSGNIIINTAVSNLPDNNILIIEGGNISLLDNWNYTDNRGIINTIYRFKFNAKIIGTGNYNLPGGDSGWFNTFISSNDFSNFDPGKKDNISIKFFQKGSTTPDGKNYTDSTEQTINISISKTRNKLNSLSFHDTNILSHSSKTERANVDEYIFNPGEDNVNAPGIPFFDATTTPEKGYKISFSLDSDNTTTGICPYFAVSAGSELNVQYDSNNKFKFSGNRDTVGTISYNETDNAYYYMPPEQPEDSDENKIIKIYYAFYYNDTVGSRQLIPICGSFIIKLNAKVTNKILFLAGDIANNFMQYTKQNNTWAFIPAQRNGTKAVLSIQDNVNFYTNNENISYCVRTIDYNEVLNENPSGSTTTSLCFDDFITTYCGHITNENIKLNVEYLGYSQSSAVDTRDIDFENMKIIPNRDNPEINYPIYINENCKVGSEELDYNVYYSNDNTNNYTIQSSILTNINNQHKIKINSDLELDECSGYYTEDDTYDTEDALYLKSKRAAGKKFNFEIQGSTAVYPLENGVIKNPADSSKYVDADNDYYYLVFKLTTEEGSIGNISFTAAKAYYFLKVRRIDPSIALVDENGTNQGEIEYFNANNVKNSFRLIPRSPIYLNRIFSQSSQNFLASMRGKFYWKFLEDAAQALSDETLALKSNTEEYIRIFNEFDKPAFENVNDVSPNSYNPNTKYNPENGEIIKWGATGTNELGHYNSTLNGKTSSGAILWVNKLMHKVGDNYEAIIGNSIPIILELYIGNSEIYKRTGNSKIFRIVIYKREYDIDFQCTDYHGNYNFIGTTSYGGRSISNPLKLDESSVITPETSVTADSLSRITSSNFHLMRLYFTSNEFTLNGASSTTQSNNTPEAEDVVKVILKAGYPCLDLQMTNTNKPLIEHLTPTITGVTGAAWNSDIWAVTDQITVQSKPLFAVYFTGLNEGSHAYARSLLMFLLTKSQAIHEVAFKIAGDEYGLYKEKTLTLYIASNNESTASVVTGD